MAVPPPKAETDAPKAEDSFSVATSAVDDHQTQLAEPQKVEPPKAEPQQSLPKTPQASKTAEGTNKRSHKRHAVRRLDQTPSSGKEEEEGKKLFTLGQEDKDKARRAVTFTKAGLLSPKKDTALVKPPLPPQTRTRGRRALFGQPAANKPSIAGSPSRLTPAQFKAEMGTVRKLSDLQARFRSITDVGKTSRPATSSPDKSIPPPPSLSKESVLLEIKSPTKTRPVVMKSPVKASPRKVVLGDTPRLTADVSLHFLSFEKSSLHLHLCFRSLSSRCPAATSSCTTSSAPWTTSSPCTSTGSRRSRRSRRRSTCRARPGGHSKRAISSRSGKTD